MTGGKEATQPCTIMILPRSKKQKVKPRQPCTIMILPMSKKQKGKPTPRIELGIFSLQVRCVTTAPYRLVVNDGVSHNL